MWGGRDTPVMLLNVPALDTCCCVLALSAFLLRSRPGDRGLSLAASSLSGLLGLELLPLFLGESLPLGWWELPLRCPPEWWEPEWWELGCLPPECLPLECLPLLCLPPECWGAWWWVEAWGVPGLQADFWLVSPHQPGGESGGAELHVAVAGSWRMRSIHINISHIKVPYSHSSLKIFNHITSL